MRQFTVYPSSYVKADTEVGDIVWTSRDGNWTAEEVDLGNGSVSYTVYKNGKRFQSGLKSLYEAMRLANVYARGPKKVKGSEDIDAAYTPGESKLSDLYRQKLCARGVYSEEELADMSDAEVTAEWIKYKKSAT